MDKKEINSPHSNLSRLYTAKKAAPFLGPHFKRSKFGRQWSGKAMQVSVPTPGTVLRELVTRENSEGHNFGLRPLSTHEKSTCGTKGRLTCAGFRHFVNRMRAFALRLGKGTLLSQVPAMAQMGSAQECTLTAPGYPNKKPPVRDRNRRLETKV